MAKEPEEGPANPGCLAPLEGKLRRARKFAPWGSNRTFHPKFQIATGVMGKNDSLVCPTKITMKLRLSTFWTLAIFTFALRYQKKILNLDNNHERREIKRSTRRLDRPSLLSFE